MSPKPGTARAQLERPGARGAPNADLELTSALCLTPHAQMRVRRIDMAHYTTVTPGPEMSTVGNNLPILMSLDRDAGRIFYLVWAFVDGHHRHHL